MSICTRASSVEEALNAVLRIVTEQHPLQPAAAYRFDDWSATLSLAVSVGLSDDFEGRHKLGDGVVGLAAEERRTVVVQADDLDTRLRIDTGVGTIEPASVICVPMLYQNTLHGALVFGCLERLDNHTRSFVEHVATHVAVAVHNLLQYEELVQLSRHLNEKSRKIARQNAALARANRMKSQFLANVSHELRTPLTAIIGFSEILKDGIIGELEPDQQEYVQDIFDSGEHLLSLINEILDLSKIEAGKMNLEVERVDLGILLNNALSIVRERAHDAGISLVADFPDDIGSAMLDPQKVRQILYNLLSNAVKFTEDGGQVRLSAARETRDDESLLVLEVDDNGIGIDPDELDRLFDPFEQAEATASRSYDGTGLGLTLVDKLVELHGGELDVDTQVGEGTLFRVTIPLDPSPEATAAARSVPSSPEPALMPPIDVDRAAPLVLIVEDDQASAKLLDLHLTRAGYRTTHVGSASAFGPALEAERPDLVVLDVLLPDGDGIDILQELRRTRHHTRLPVVIVSIAAEDVRDRGFAVGASSVLQKPVDVETLLKCVAEEVEHHPEADDAPLVLIVDDEPSSIEYIARRLDSSGYRTLRALTGEEALDLVEQQRPDLAIVDLMMPGMNGFELIRRLREGSASARFPIVVLTAKKLTADDRKTLHEHADLLVEKHHFNAEAFLDAVQSELRELPPDQPPVKPATTQPMRRVSMSVVLLAGFDPDEADVVTAQLQEIGYLVTEAHDLDEIRTAVGEHRPSAVVVDFDGVSPDVEEYLLKVRDNDTPPPVIGVSHDRVDELSQGPAVVSVLPKPLPRDGLLRAIESLAKTVDRDKPVVLVVDDEPASLRVVQGFLSGEPYRVETALGGREGLRLIEEIQPDLLVLDLMMPDCSGFDVIASLEDSDESNKLPVVVLTSKHMSAAERRRLATRARMVVQKDKTDRDDFAQRVRQIVSEVKL